MKKRKITIEFETDASDDAVDELAFLMKVQLESLNDGTMCLDEDETVAVDEPYENVTVKVE